ncbi:DUF927 domain-containing protein [Lichenibacterium minor]|uniref:DUF927 domain-containing protein n=1 Tax=Lichenibacterium minor TaxID=2316528 RepID=A0A4Q2U4C7_9HYPH|nr:DUF927 domain-containing protein [Lichenibacterium minor]RYC31393.1 DUF927 domain-containing protein [Lichenibacterium minor]
MAEAETYVVTRDIKAAVQGRETDVLDALNIDWRRCTKSSHIACPYPDHQSNGDNWRWDARKAKAFCSCLSDGHADSILDVVMKCDGVDIEGAKIRAAEAIGRSDLIKTKGGGKGGQRMDATSLLNPPAGSADAGLPVAYLAHRLGIAPGDVLMPSTAAVGWMALTYWEAPSKPGGKPVDVGQFPAVAFSTVAADGGLHCHRIYVAPGGAGKADLGTGPNGRARDPKKSAKAPADGASTAGRSVMWGSAGKAPHVIVTEGIETGAAVAHAFRREVEVGEIAVAAAISTAGVAAWQPWPATRQVTIAADRDEAPKDGRAQPTKAGERAARELGMRRHDEGSAIETRIVLPGTPGTATDWLDTLRADGVDAVRGGIERAARFVPTAAELRERAEKVGRQAELERIATLYPVPILNGRTLFYDFASDGRIWLHKEFTKGSGENAVVLRAPIASPFGITARLRVVDDADAYGLRLLLEDMDGHPRAVDIERKNLAAMGGAEARGLFLEAGVRFQDDGELVAVAALKAAHPDQEIRIVRHPGWHDAGGARFYVAPGGEVIGLPEGQSVELAAGSVMPETVARGGTLDGWKAGAAAAVNASGCPHFTLGLAAGFAGVLVDLCGLDSVGINLSGQTSAGKTTAQRLAASVWSVPDSTRPGLFQVAKTTVNGFEFLAAKANGSVFALDELAHLSGKETARVVYTLASGVGKARMTANATARDPHRWKTFAILSSETSLEAKITADGESWTGGQAVRIADVDVTGINRMLDAGTFAKIASVSRHHGHAGPTFVRALVAAGTHERAAEVRDKINEGARRLAGPGADAATIRAALPLAILAAAGSFAQAFGLLPAGTAVNDAVRWAWAGFKASSDAQALDPAEQAIGNLRQWIAERWNTSIHWLDAEMRPTRDALGWWDDRAIYLTPDRLIEGSGGTLKEGLVAKALSGAGMLAKTKDAEHLCISFVPKVGRLKAYALSRNHFGRDQQDEPFKAYAGGRA